jgi:hypothetical protein
MRRFIPQMSVARRQQILDEARAAGRMGTQRLPYSVHASDPSDSMLVQALDAHAQGLAEREAETPVSPSC